MPGLSSGARINGEATGCRGGARGCWAADRIVVVDGGEIVQRGSPADVFEQPASPFVAQFTGSNCVSLRADDIRESVRTTNGEEWLAVRPEDVHIEDGADGVTATVERVLREDATFRVSLSVAGERFDAYTTDPPSEGSSVSISFDGASKTLL